MDKRLMAMWNKALVAHHARQVESSISEFIVAGDCFQVKCAEAKGVLLGTAHELRSHQERYLVDCRKACRMAGKFVVAQEYVSNELAKVAAAAVLYQRYKHEVTKNGE